uniref:M-phase-specific PLK1-interacting protein n=1 Tax=Phallusia mammillata TaxID=59560 RepID=A0A6F9DKF6_9ASCI|nr:M-phase-specific PLK1-interacting protein [Phallusia mammillata]
MNSRHFSPNSNQNFNSPNGMQHNRMRGRSFNSPTWQSPPWVGQNSGNNYQSPGNINEGPRRGAWKNDYKPSRGYYNSPNSPNFHSNKSFNQTSTPRGNQRQSFGNSSHNSSGFIPLPTSRNFSRHNSPYSRGNNRPYRGGRNFSGQKSYQRQSFGQQPIESYFKPSMLENPWAVFTKDNHSSGKKDSSIILPSKPDCAVSTT